MTKKLMAARAKIQQRQDLRQMLSHQLDMFERGVLTLRSNEVDISRAAIADLKRSILRLDAQTREAVWVA